MGLKTAGFQYFGVSVKAMHWHAVTCCGNTSWAKISIRPSNFKFEENRSFLSSMTAKICFKMLMKSLVEHFQSTEFSLGD